MNKNIIKPSISICKKCRFLSAKYSYECCVYLSQIRVLDAMSRAIYTDVESEKKHLCCYSEFHATRDIFSVVKSVVSVVSVVKTSFFSESIYVLVCYQEYTANSLIHSLGGGLQKSSLFEGAYQRSGDTKVVTRNISMFTVSLS